MKDLAKRIKEKARECGFDAAGIAHPVAVAASGAHLMEFLRLGRHGTMHWMEARAEERAHPNALWPEARSVIVCAMNYGPARSPLAALEQSSHGAISVYAQGSDYHDIVKKRLKRLARWLCEQEECEVKVFVDTAPVMEKPLAQAAGLGWQGKHTNLLARDHGSWLFLGAVFTTLDLEPDKPETDHCGSCRRCLDVCPTDAFPAPWQLDARRCISYLTIEHKGHIPRELRGPMGNRIYGCDDCLAVCPWNKFARRAHEAAFHARAELDLPPLGDLVELDDAGFRTVFSGSPIKRTGRDRFVRNVLIAIGNSGNPALAPAAERRLADGSPLVRAAAVWALSRLLAPAAFRMLYEIHAKDETDADVAGEWAAVLAPLRHAG